MTVDQWAINTYLTIKFLLSKKTTIFSHFYVNAVILEIKNTCSNAAWPSSQGKLHIAIFTT